MQQKPDVTNVFLIESIVSFHTMDILALRIWIALIHTTLLVVNRLVKKVLIMSLIIAQHRKIDFKG